MTPKILLAAAGDGGGFTPPSNAFTLTAAPEGGWIFYSDPKAIHYGSLTYFGFVNGDGDIIVRSVDPVTRTVSGESVMHAALEVDDHANPALLIRDSDHRLMVFYSKHNDTTTRLRVSTTSLDTDPDISDGFAAEVSLDASIGGEDYSYVYPMQLTGETNDPIYLFVRDIPGSGSTSDWVLTKSTNGGSTWSAKTVIYSDTGRFAYMHAVRNGDDRIDFAVSDGHPFHQTDTSIHHFYYEAGAYHESDGTVITLPVNKSKATTIYDGTTTRSWIWDIAIDPNTGHPVVVYTTYPGGDGSDHRYNYARWTGSAWDTNEIAAGGTHIYSNGDEPYYSGGISIDRLNTSRVYLSRQAPTQWELFAYTTADGGTTWTSRALTSGSASKQIRPTSVYDADPRLRVMWMSGTYNTFTDWDTGTKGGR